MFNFRQWFSSSTPSPKLQPVQEAPSLQNSSKAISQATHLPHHSPSYTTLDSDTFTDRSKPTLEAPSESFTPEDLDALFESAQKKFTTARPDIQAISKPSSNRRNERLLQHIQILILLQQVTNERIQSYAEYEEFLQSTKTRVILQSTNEYIKLSELKALEASKMVEYIEWIPPIAALIGGLASANPTAIVAGLLSFSIVSLQRTGALDAAIEALAKHLEGLGIRKEDVQYYLPLILTLVTAGVSVGASINAGFSRNLNQFILQIGNIASMTTSIGQMATQMANADRTFEIRITESKLTDFEGDVNYVDYHIEQVANALKESLEGSHRLLKLGSNYIKNSSAMLATVYNNV